MQTEPVEFSGIMVQVFVAILALGLFTLWLVRIAKRGWTRTDTAILLVPCVLLVLVVPVGLLFVGFTRPTAVRTTSVDYVQSSDGRSVSLKVGDSPREASVPSQQNANAWPYLSESGWQVTPATDTEQAADGVVSVLRSTMEPGRSGGPRLMIASNEVAMRDAVLRKLRKVEPTWTVVAMTESQRRDMDRGNQAADGQTWVNLHVTRTGRLDRGTLPQSGSVQVRMVDASSGRTEAIAFHDARWLTDPQAVQREYGKSTWHVARSSATCATIEEAREEMIDDALQLLGWTAPTRQDFGPSDETWALRRDEMRERLMQQEPRLVVDQVEQTVEASYGTIYRAAMLFDTQRADAFVETGSHVTAQSTPPGPSTFRRSVYRTWDDMAQSNSVTHFLLLGLGVLVTSWMLNLVSRGYYQVRIIVAAALVAAVLLMFVA